MELLQSQKAEVFEILKKCGLSPASVEFKTQLSRFSGESMHVIVVKGTNFYFTFDNHHHGRRTEFSPASEAINAETVPPNWISQATYLSNWCKYVQRELTAPDPWGNLSSQLVGAPIFSGDAAQGQKFTVPEYEQVDRTLEVIKALLVTYAERNEQTIKQIQTDIGQLKGMAKLQDRKSFFQQVVGYIASTATSMGLDPEKTRALWESLKVGFNGIVLLLRG